MQLYKANKKVTGGALSLRWDAKLFPHKKNENNKDGNFCFWMSLVAQSDWEDRSRTGRFRGSKIVTKLSVYEVGTLIYCFRNFCGLDGVGYEKGFYHSSGGDDPHTAITLRYNDNGWVLACYKGDDKVSVSISLGESVAVTAFLETGLKHIFDGMASMVETNFKNSKKNAESGDDEEDTPKRTPAKKAAAKKKARPVAVPAGGDDEEEEDNPF